MKWGKLSRDAQLIVLLHTGGELTCTLEFLGGFLDICHVPSGEGARRPEAAAGCSEAAVQKPPAADSSSQAGAAT